MATITFIGAAQQVTGSCYLLQTSNTRLLLECGTCQGREAHGPNHEDREDRILRTAGSIDVVVLSHAHLDHSGTLPRLVRAGYRGAIFCTAATIDLLRVLLTDALFLHLKDIESENRWRERAGKPVLEPEYMPGDIDKVISLCKPVPYGRPETIAADISLTFLDAGHILGSSIVQLDITDGKTRRRVVFSGDLGNAESVLMPTPQRVDRADVVLLEGTYGNRNHRSYKETIAEFSEALASAHRDGGNVLIPAFAVGRTQEVLFHIARLREQGRLKQTVVVLDSPMAIEVTELYQRHRHLLDSADLRELGDGGNFKRALDFLRLSRTTEDSMAINRFQGGAIILAGSGMCEGGRIRHHFKHNLWRRQTHVIFVGYQAEGTLGRRIVNGEQTVTLFGNEIAVKAQVHTLGGFSAHAGQSQLMDWARHIGNKPRMYLIHGEAAPLQTLQAALARDAGIEAHVPSLAEVVEL